MGGAVFTTLILVVTVLSPMMVVYYSRIDNYHNVMKSQIKFLFVTFLICIVGASSIITAKMLQWLSFSMNIKGIKFNFSIFKFLIFSSIFLLVTRIPSLYNIIQELLDLHIKAIGREVKENAEKQKEEFASEIAKLPSVESCPPPPSGGR